MSDVSPARGLLLHEDDCLLAACKCAGLETVAESGACFTTYLRQELHLPELEPVHRLDRDTTGVQLFAKTSSAKGELEAAFRHRKTEKQYLAACLGIPANADGTIRKRLSNWSGGRRPVQVVKGSDGLEAETAYHLLSAFYPDPRNMGPGVPASLILFLPHQGRTHQIRVHAASIEKPVLGDDQYGDRPANKRVKDFCGLKRQALHAWRITLPHPKTRQPLTLTAPVPDDMVALLTPLFPAWEETLPAAP